MTWARRSARFFRTAAVPQSPPTTPGRADSLCRRAEKAARLLWWDGDPYSGQAAIIPGHNLSADVLDRVMLDMFGPGDYETGEVWAEHMPRVKWCERYDGWGCDDNSEWHGHWFGVKPNPDAPSIRWTLLWESEDTRSTPPGTDAPS